MPGEQAIVATGGDSMQNVCMGVLVQIRDVDRSVRDRLKEKAARRGQSLNTYLRELMERDSRVPSREEILARLRDRGDLLAAETPSTVEVLESARAERLERLDRPTEP